MRKIFSDVVVETVKRENVNPEDDIFPSTSGTARHEVKIGQWNTNIFV